VLARLAVLRVEAAAVALGPIWWMSLGRNLWFKLLKCALLMLRI
jgi:hypothetical protein